MMGKKPQLSILLPFQNRRSAVEKILTPLYELSTFGFELFIIDDASTDGTGQAIHSLLDYYDHEHTFFFEHDKPAGRGNCLNELLWQVNTPVVWVPHSLEKVDERSLKKAVKKLASSDSGCLVQQFSVPDDDESWLNMIRERSFPEDGQFLWNLNNIGSTRHFFSPFLNRFHCLEWLMRLGSSASLSFSKRFYDDSEESIAPTSFERREIAASLLRRTELPAETYKQTVELIKKLPRTSPQKTDAEVEHELLEKSVRLKEDGQLSAALEIVEKVLSREPGNNEAKRLKIEILERKRRFVEASELKHELSFAAKVSPNKDNEKPAGIQPDQIKTSIIIPTVLHGKPALEHCLLSIAEYCNPASTEIVIVDNASLDDTFDYLEELKEKNFFNCKVITNTENKGFAASINQGFEAALGDYFCVIHNDVEFESPAVAQLEQLMDENPQYALLGPLTDSTLNPDQLISKQNDAGKAIEETEFLDSFLMMIRTGTGVEMDEKYTLAFFDDIDFSFQMREAGHKAGIATGVSVTHHYGNTTFALDLDTESRLYWKNIAAFNEKWNVESFSEEELQGKNELEQLLLLEDRVNPLYPETAIKEKFAQLFTSEMKTQILKQNHNKQELRRLTRLFMIMEERDTMRRLEDRLTKPDLPVTFIYELVRFYFNKNIYSRCLHYLDRLTMHQQTLQSQLYRLAILIDEKKIEQAVPKLTALLEKAPSNPFLYKLAGDIYAFQNDNEEAKSFYRLAEQINPFEYSLEKESR